MHSKDHWEKVYSTRREIAVSWFQPHANILSASSRPRVLASMPPSSTWRGASMLVDDLLENGFTNVSCSIFPLPRWRRPRERLAHEPPKYAGSRRISPKQTCPLANTMSGMTVPFPFSHQPGGSRRLMVKAVFRSVKPGGHVISPTFAEDGPLQCSGLPVMALQADDCTTSSAISSGSWITGKKHTQRHPARCSIRFTAIAAG